MQVFKQQHGLKVFENRVLREICVTEGTGKDVLCTTGRYTGGAEVQQHSILNSMFERGMLSMPCP